MEILVATSGQDVEKKKVTMAAEVMTGAAEATTDVAETAMTEEAETVMTEEVEIAMTEEVVTMTDANSSSPVKETEETETEDRYDQQSYAMASGNSCRTDHERPKYNGPRETFHT